jgi:hypothetical protein
LGEQLIRHDVQTLNEHTPGSFVYHSKREDIQVCIITC